MPLNETQTRIIQAMKIMDRPVTVKDLAKELGVTGQTIRNHLPALGRMGRVEISQRLSFGNSTHYQLTDGGSASVNPISWKTGEMVSIRAIFELIGKENLSTNPYWGNIERVILKLYEFSVAAIDDENPQMPSAIQLRELRRLLESIYTEAGFVRDSVGDLLEYQELWEPRNLPKALIINDTKLDLEKAIDIIDRANG